MLCPYCSNQIDDTSKFCPCCGNALQSAPAAAPQPSYFAPMEFSEPVSEQPQYTAPEQPQYPAYQQSQHPAYQQPQYPAYQQPQYQNYQQPQYDPYAQAAYAGAPVPPAPKKKGKLGLIIGLAAGGLALIIAAIVLIISLNNPTAIVTRAFGKTASAYTSAMSDLPLDKMANLTKAEEGNVSMDLRLDYLNPDLGAEIPSGLGIHLDGAASLDDRSMDTIVTAYYGAADIVSVESALRDNMFYVRSEDVLGSDYFAVNTETIGQVLYEQGAFSAEEASLTINVFDLLNITREMMENSKESQVILEDAAKELAASVIIEKGEYTSLNINNTWTDCKGYTVTIPQAALETYLEAVESYMEATQSLEYMEQILRAIGMPEEEISYVIEDTGLEELDYAFEEMYDALEEIGDLVLQVYISDGYISAVIWEPDLGVDSSIGLYLGGGDNYVDDWSVAAEVDGETMMALTSSGNHSGKNGTYTDTLCLEVYGYYGSEQFISEISYQPGNIQDNLELHISAGGISIDARGNLHVSGDSMALYLDQLNLGSYYGDMATVCVTYAVDKYDPLLSPTSGIMILEMSEEELQDLVYGLQDNMMGWAYGLMEQFPDLAAEIMG